MGDASSNRLPHDAPAGDLLFPWPGGAILSSAEGYPAAWAGAGVGAGSALSIGEAFRQGIDAQLQGGAPSPWSSFSALQDALHESGTTLSTDAPHAADSGMLHDHATVRPDAYRNFQDLQFQDLVGGAGRPPHHGLVVTEEGDIGLLGGDERAPALAEQRALREVAQGGRGDDLGLGDLRREQGHPLRSHSQTQGEALSRGQSASSSDLGLLETPGSGMSMAAGRASAGASGAGGGAGASGGGTGGAGSVVGMAGVDVGVGPAATGVRPSPTSQGSSSASSFAAPEESELDRKIVAALQQFLRGRDWVDITTPRQVWSGNTRRPLFANVSCGVSCEWSCFACF